MTSRRTIGLSLVWFLTTSMALANIWRLDTLPFTDLPNHLAEAYIYSISDEPDHPLNREFSIDVTPITPNSLHVVFCSWFDDVEVGNRVYYSAAILILLGGMALLVRLARGEPWLALLASMLIYNYNMVWGFTGATLGVVLLLPVAAVLAAWIRRPGIPWALVLTALMVVAFRNHALMFLVAALIVVCATLSRTVLPWRTRLLGLLPLAPATMLLAMWSLQARAFSDHEPLPSYLAAYFRTAYFPTLAKRLARFGANENFRLAEGVDGVLIATAFTLPIIVLLATGIWHRRRELARLVEDPVHHVAVVFTAVTALCYLLVPEALPGEPMLYQRFSVAVLCGVLWLASFITAGRIRTVVIVLTVPFVLVHGLLWHRYFDRVEQQAEPLIALMGDIPPVPHEALTAIMVVPRLAGIGHKRGFETIHYLNYRLIRQGGVVTSSATGYRFRILNRLDDSLPAYRAMAGEDFDRREIVAYYDAVEHVITNDAASVDALVDAGYTLVSERAEYRLLSRPASPGTPETTP